MRGFPVGVSNRLPEGRTGNPLSSAFRSPVADRPHVENSFRDVVRTGSCGDFPPREQIFVELVEVLDAARGDDGHLGVGPGVTYDSIRGALGPRAQQGRVGEGGGLQPPLRGLRAADQDEAGAARVDRTKAVSLDASVTS